MVLRNYLYIKHLAATTQAVMLFRLQEEDSAAVAVGEDRIEGAGREEGAAEGLAVAPPAGLVDGGAVGRGGIAEVQLGDAVAAGRIEPAKPEGNAVAGQLAEVQAIGKHHRPALILRYIHHPVEIAAVGRSQAI